MTAKQKKTGSNNKYSRANGMQLYANPFTGLPRYLKHRKAKSLYIKNLLIASKNMRPLDYFELLALSDEYSEENMERLQKYLKKTQKGSDAWDKVKATEVFTYPSYSA